MAVNPKILNKTLKRMATAIVLRAVWIWSWTRKRSTASKNWSTVAVKLASESSQLTCAIRVKRIHLSHTASQHVSEPLPTVVPAGTGFDSSFRVGHLPSEYRPRCPQRWLPSPRRESAKRCKTLGWRTLVTGPSCNLRFLSCMRGHGGGDRL